MALSSRLNMIFGALLTVAVVLLSLALMMRAVPRAVEEERMMLQTAVLLTNSTLNSLTLQDKPQPGFEDLVRQLRALKHIRVTMLPRASERERDAEEDWGPWFTEHFITSSFQSPVVIPVRLKGVQSKKIELRSEPGDEIQEILNEGFDIILFVVLLSSIIFVITTLVVRHSLAPLRALSKSVRKLQIGEFDIDRVQTGTKELEEITTGLAELSSALSATRRKNRELSAKLVQAQDAERKDLARELHDELGAYLFSIRARASALNSSLVSGDFDVDTAVGYARGMIAHLDALQVAHRRVLQRLSPPGLKEVGLVRALHGLLDQWQQEHPEISIKADIRLPEDDLGETIELTVFRMVQEGLTNAYKHARANKINVSVAGREATEGEPAGSRFRLNADADEAVHLIVSISDDGCGLMDDFSFGFGLTSMRERLAGLGGALELLPNVFCGTRLHAQIPLASLSNRAEDPNE